MSEVRMSNIGICEYCKYIDKDIMEKPCLHCAANLGAFEFDLSEHDKRIRADAIEEYTQWLKKQIVGIDNISKKILVVRNDKWVIANEEFITEQLKESEEV